MALSDSVDRRYQGSKIIIPSKGPRFINLRGELWHDLARSGDRYCGLPGEVIHADPGDPSGTCIFAADADRGRHRGQLRLVDRHLFDLVGAQGLGTDPGPAGAQSGGSVWPVADVC